MFILRKAATLLFETQQMPIQFHRSYSFWADWGFAPLRLFNSHEHASRKAPSFTCIPILGWNWWRRPFFRWLWQHAAKLWQRNQTTERASHAGCWNKCLQAGWCFKLHGMGKGAISLKRVG